MKKIQLFSLLVLLIFDILIQFSYQQIKLVPGEVQRLNPTNDITIEHTFDPNQTYAVRIYAACTTGTPANQKRLKQTTLQISISLKNEGKATGLNAFEEQRAYQLRDSGELYSDFHYFPKDNFFEQQAFDYCKNNQICTVVFTIPSSQNSNYYVILLEEQLNTSIFTPININKILDLNIQQYQFSPPQFSPQRQSSILEARYTFQYNSTLIFDNNEFIQNLNPEYISHYQKRVVNSINDAFTDLKSRDQGLQNLGGRFNFNFGNLKEPGYTQDLYNVGQVRVFTCESECVIQIQVAHNERIINNYKQRTLDTYEMLLYQYQFQIVKSKTPEGQLSLDEDVRFQCHKYASSKLIQYIQIERNMTSSKDTIYTDLKFIVFYENSNQNKQNEVLLSNIAQMYQYLYSHSNFNKNQFYLCFFQPEAYYQGSDFVPTIIRVFNENNLRLYTKDDKIWTKRIESTLALKYRASDDASVITYRRANSRMNIYVNKCTNNGNNCVVPTQYTYQYKCERNSQNNNQQFETKLEGTKVEYYVALLDQADIYYQNYEESNFNYQMHQYSYTRSKSLELFINDKYIFSSVIPNWGYVLIFEISTILFLMLFCTGQFYVYKHKLPEIARFYFEKLKIKLKLKDVEDTEQVKFANFAKVKPSQENSPSKFSEVSCVDTKQTPI